MTRERIIETENGPTFLQMEPTIGSSSYHIVFSIADDCFDMLLYLPLGHIDDSLKTAPRDF